MSVFRDSWFVRVVILGIFLTLVAVVFYLPLIKFLPCLGQGDWDYYIFNQAVAYTSLTQYHQFPFWNPYNSGGMPAFANPQSRFLSPATLWTALWGVVPGMKVEMIVHTVLGMFGMFLLMRYWRVQFLPAVLSGVIYAFNGHAVLHTAAGHVTWSAMMYLPFLFLFYLKGMVRARYFCLSAGILSLMFYEGATYITIFSGLFLAFYAGMHALQERSWRPLKAVILIFGLSFLFSGPKLLPTLEFLFQFPRLVPPGGSLDLKDLYLIFLGYDQRLHNHFLAGNSGAGWWEYGAYVGNAVFLLFILSFRFFKDRWPLFLSFGFFLILGMGNVCRVSLWNIFHHLPVFNTLQCPARSYFIVVFIMAMGVGWTLNDIWQGRGTLKRVRFLVVILLSFFIIFDLFQTNASSVRDTVTPFQVGKEQFSKGNAFRQIEMSPGEKFRFWGWSAMYPVFLGNQGVVNGYEPIPVTCNAAGVNQKVYRGEYYLVSGSGKVFLAYWSPNKMIFDYDIKTPATLVVNQNYDRDWRSSVAGELKSFQGLLAVELDPGKHSVALAYFPFSVVLGLAGAGLGLAVLFLRRRLFSWLSLPD